MKFKYVKFSHPWILFSFWALVFLLNTGPHWEIYSTTVELIETVGMITALQMMVAVITLKLLIPQILNKNHKVLFFIALFVLIFFASELNIFIRYNYHEKVYASSYTSFLEMFGQMKLSERMFSLWSFKYIFFTKLPLYFFPTALLIAHKFYKNQTEFLRLNEQKRQAELDALKNQLNPHFIFNTLNNLYALSLKKSDLAPMVIEKLSNILDYILYRCNDKYVSLNSEIQLIENYIDLEKVRYGKRISVNFTHDVKHNVSIAPLILLTLVENACKHSTSEELNKSSIDIHLYTSESKIHFKIMNTKPKHFIINNNKVDKIGLANMRKQLNLLYPNSHTLSVTDNKDSYQVRLMVKSQ